MRSVGLVLALTCAAAAAVSMGASALFSDSHGVGATVFTTDTLDPPTSPISSGTTTTILDWTATPDTYAAGHRVLRGTVDGGPYSQVGADVTPRTTTTFSESPAAGTYYYVLRAYYQNWESVNSAQVTVAVTP